MMLTLNDGRAELWQWDTGRTLAVDSDCSQVHFSNKVFGRSIDVDVVNGAAIIPDILLQTDKDLNVWAFVGTAENGYTKISKTFKVNRRNKPADYVFTPPDQTSLEEIKEKIDYLESKFATDIPSVDDTLTQSGQAADAKATGDALRSLSEEIANIPGGGSGLTTAEKTAMLALFKAAAYTSDVSATITQLETIWNGSGDSGGETEVTLTSISATYSGGDVAAGTALSDLTGIVVTATYSDGSTATVTGYTLSGEIAEGNNTITVTYQDKTATIIVTGTAVAKTYTVTNNLTNVTTTNAATTIAQGAIYAASLSAQSGYDLSDVTITMGGEDVTALYYAYGAISIPSVTGDIVVTATATISAGTDWNIIYCLNGSDPTDRSNSEDRLVRIDTSNSYFWLVASFIKSGAQSWVDQMYFRKADGSKLGSLDIRRGYSEVSKYKIGNIEFWVCKYDISNIINYMNDNSISSFYGDIRDPRIVPNGNLYPYVFAAQTEITEAMLRAITGLE